MVWVCSLEQQHTGAGLSRHHFGKCNWMDVSTCSLDPKENWQATVKLIPNQAGASHPRDISACCRLFGYPFTLRVYRPSPQRPSSAGTRSAASVLLLEIAKKASLGVARHVRAGTHCLHSMVAVDSSPAADGCRGKEYARKGLLLSNRVPDLGIPHPTDKIRSHFLRRISKQQTPNGQ